MLKKLFIRFHKTVVGGDLLLTAWCPYGIPEGKAGGCNHSPPFFLVGKDPDLRSMRID